MNRDTFEGNWEQMKGTVRQQWGKITEDDLISIKGKRQELAGKIQERYGYAKEEVETEIDRFLEEGEFADRYPKGTDSPSDRTPGRG